MKHAWVMGLVLLVWPIGSVGLQRGIVLIEDASGRPVPLYQDSYALVVGVSRYRNGWPSLPGVPDDVRKVQATLKDHGFKVTLVEDPDHEQLQRAFTEFITAHGGTPDNRLLFYFAGHGATLEQAYGGEMGYIVPTDAPLPDADRDGFLAMALDMRAFDLFARRIQSKHALFLFDSCFSGSIFALSRAVPMNISYKTARPVRQFITSGSKDETVPDKSIFRQQFLEALAGEGDTNGDGYVSGTELGEFLQGKVVNYSYGAQHPQYGKIRDPRLDKGDFVFALAKPSEPPPPPPPPPVRWQGNVQVNVNVPARVYIDEQPAGEAGPEKPLNRQGVAVGRTAVRVEAQGFQPATQWAQVKRGEWTQLIFELAPVEENARLTVRSNVYGDVVYIDGKPMGSTRLDVELVPGRHVVRVEKEGYLAHEEAVELAAGRAMVVRANLSKEPVAVELAGSVTPVPRASVSPSGVGMTADTAAERQTGEIWTDPVMGMGFVWIPKGCFQMGSPETEQGRFDDEHQHRVCLEGFWLGKYEVTNAQYRRFRADHSSGVVKGQSLNGDEQPVVGVDWHAATAFAEWLSQQSGERLRLPTEAEWEYAARAGTETARYWGESPDEGCDYANVSDKPWKSLFSWDFTPHDCEDGYAANAPVGRFGPNSFGLYDMLGNVWEWTCSVYEKAYRGLEKDCGSIGGKGLRVPRGGSRDSHPPSVRSANRGGNTPDYREYKVGFRLARTP